MENSVDTLYIVSSVSVVNALEMHTMWETVSASCSKSKMLRKVKACVPAVSCSVVSLQEADLTLYQKQEEAEEKQRFCVEPRGWRQHALLAQHISA